MKNKKWYIIGGSVLAIVLVWTLFFRSGKQEAEQKVRASRGPFEIIVAITGELKARSMERIEGPEEMRSRSIRIQDVKIQDLVPEGTVVKKGDYVASLDRTTSDNRVKDIEDEVEKIRAQLERTLLDTSLTLRGIRNNLASLKFDLEEKQIAVEQSVYEPPATQRQTQNNLERAQRAYDQEVQNYTLKEAQAIAQVRDVRINLSQKEREMQQMQDVLSKFTVFAPNDGMVIYHREWSGEKRKVGSSISPWDLTIATLPDLSTMESKTYVNEIDISKVKKGQVVRIGVDAFPDKQYTGMVTEVSNIGEQLKNADAKVFEVIVRINESDDILRPAMTTSNKIVTGNFDNVVYVPIEALFGNDTLMYVCRTNGTRQVVVPGEANENFRIIEQGLSEGDEVYLSYPKKAEAFKLTGTEYIAVLQERVQKKKEAEEERKRNGEERGKENIQQLQEMPQGQIRRTRGGNNNSSGNNNPR